MYFVQMLDYPTAGLTAARHINNPGRVIGEALGVSSARLSLAVLWDSQVPAVIWPITTPQPIGTNPIAEGINDSGDIVITGNWDAFLYRDGAMTPTPAMELGHTIFAHDINNDGIVTGTVAIGFRDWPAFVFDSKADTPPALIHTAEGAGLKGVAINNDGHVLCVSPPQWPSSTASYLYVAGELTELFLEGTVVNDLNDAGLVVGARKFDGNAQSTAFVCDTSTKAPEPHDLGALTSFGHQTSVANCINSHGSVVGKSSINDRSDSRAFVCPAKGQMQDLTSLLVPKDSGWTLTDARSINDRGQIVGLGTYYGQLRGFLLTPVRIPVIPGVDPHYHHLDLLSRIYSLVAGSAGVWFGPGTRPRPIDPDGRLWDDLPPERRDLLLSLAVHAIASGMQDGRQKSDIEQAALEVIRKTLDQFRGQ